MPAYPSAWQRTATLWDNCGTWQLQASPSTQSWWLTAALSLLSPVTTAACWLGIILHTGGNEYLIQRVFHSLPGLFLCSNPLLDNPMFPFSIEPLNKAPPILGPMRALFHGQHAIWPGTRLVWWCCLAIRTDPHPHGNSPGPGEQKKKVGGVNVQISQWQKLA